MRTRKRSKYVFGLVFLVILSALQVKADFSLNATSSITPCDEFATLVLHDPWDMSNTADVVNFASNDLNFLSSPAFGSGLFTFGTTLTGGGTFRLLAPPLPSTQAVGGRWGNNTPIDTSKYTTMTVRMGLASLDAGQGLRFVWNRGSDYGKYLTFTNNTTTKAGWGSYTVNFNTVGIDASSDDTSGWSTGNIKGIGILPTVTTQNVSVDFVRLEDPTSCGSGTVQYTVTASGTNDYFNLYVDDDTNPFNGFNKKLVSGGTLGSSSASINSLGLAPGTYQIVGVQDGDYATLNLDDPWNFTESTDVSLLGSVTNPTYSNGIFSGTASAAGPQIYLNVDSTKPINTSTFKFLSFKMSPRVDLVLGWGSGATTVFAASADPDGDGVYAVDLSNVPAWSGSLSSLIFIPQFPAATNFTFDFVQLRSRGYTTSDTNPTTSSGTSFTVSAVPQVKIVQPDIKGGEAFKPWNFRAGDTAFEVNLNLGADTLHPGEPLSGYLPDVRTVDSVRGDFFKGTNIAGNDDPNDYLNFPQFTTTNNYLINASEYRNMCLRMNIDRDFDLTLGSVTKLVFSRADGAIEELDAWGTIYDRWEGTRWYEYCSDLTTHLSEKGETGRWSGDLNYLRVDPHEFHLDSCCDAKGNPIGNPIWATYYLDYLKLRKDDTAKGAFAIIYSTSDADSPTLTTTFYYNTSNTTTGGTAIATSDLNCEGQVCIWNTTKVTNGTYYLYARISDGTNSSTTMASGRIKIDNSTPTTTNPVLSIESPKANDTICSSMQVKGYSLISQRYEDVAAVQVFVDDVYYSTIIPSLYSPKAVAEYPTADSSNTGFNSQVDIRGVANGSHVIKLKAYAPDGGTTTTSLSVTKPSGCSDPAVVTDAAPSGTPSTANLIDNSVGTGLNMSVTTSGEEIDYTITGTKNCTLVRIGTASKAAGPFTYFYGNSDASAIGTNIVLAKTTTVPRFIGKPATAPKPTNNSAAITAAKKKLARKKLGCKKAFGSKKKACKNQIKKLTLAVKTLQSQTGQGSGSSTPATATSVYFTADCNQGSVVSSVQSLESLTFGNAAGSPCENASNLVFSDWFNCFTFSIASNTKNR